MTNKIPEPKSANDKIKLAKELYDSFSMIRDAKDVANWEEGRLLYFFEKYHLYRYLFGSPLSKAAFYAEIDVPYSTAQFKISLYEFYIVKHGFGVEELRKANTKKLHRALAFIKTWPKNQVKEVIDLAEREKQSLSDFLVSIGAPDKYCVHQDCEEVKVKQCVHCKKQMK